MITYAAFGKVKLCTTIVIGFLIFGDPLHKYQVRLLFDFKRFLKIIFSVRWDFTDYDWRDILLLPKTEIHTVFILQIKYCKPRLSYRVIKYYLFTLQILIEYLTLMRARNPISGA